MTKTLINLLNPTPEFLSFAQAQLEILPSPSRGEGTEILPKRIYTHVTRPKG